MAQIQYFLGANTPAGFYSLYDHLIDLDAARAVYILKGGPGCGKSSFMRRIARHAQAAGYSTQFILCSGDPGSLDGLVIPALKTALVDGTAPHGVVPLGHFASHVSPAAKRNPQSAASRLPAPLPKEPFSVP